MSREEYDGVKEARKEVLGHLVRLCDTFGEIKNVGVKSQIVNMATGLQLFSVSNAGSPQLAVEYLLDCATEIPPKVPAYAGIVAVLAVKGHTELASLALRTCSERLHAHLQEGAHPQARGMLRFLAACAAYGAIPASVVHAVMAAVVNAAGHCAMAGAGRAHTLWQPYCDSLVRITLLALPFGMPALREPVKGSDAAQEEDALGRLLSTVGAYMAMRPATVDRRFGPTGALPDGTECGDDSGMYSLTGDTFQAVQECHAQGKWTDVQTVRLFQSDLAEVLMGLTPLEVELAPIEAPVQPPRVDPQANEAVIAAALVEHYGPRGRMRILDPAVTRGTALLLERIMFEDYVTDIIDVWHDDRTECVKRLATLPVSPTQAASYAPMLAEALFGQVLRLPVPRHRLIAYFVVMVDLCRLKSISFSRAMSGCMRELFKLMGTLDAALRDRLAEYLAYHLSYFDFIWPWDKWAHVVGAPKHDPQRHFCQLLLARVLRVSYWGKLLDSVPASFEPLRPSEPLPDPARPPSVSTADLGGLEPWRSVADEVAGMTSGRDKVSEAELGDYLGQAGLRERLGGSAALLRAVVRGVLEGGAKSLTHSVAALERYAKPIKAAVEALEGEGEAVCIEAAADFYKHNPQRFLIMIDRMMGLRFVGVEALVRWCAAQPALTSVQDPLPSATVWEALHGALDRMVARTTDCVSDVQQAAGVLGQSRDYERDALAKLEQAREARERGESRGLGEEEEIEGAEGRVVAARQRVLAAEQALQDAQDALRTAEEDERRALLQALSLLIARLGDPAAMPPPPPPKVVHPRAVFGADANGGGGDDEMGETGELDEEARRTLEVHRLIVRIGGVARKYLARLAPKWGELDGEVCAQGRVHPRVRDAVVGVFTGI